MNTSERGEQIEEGRGNSVRRAERGLGVGSVCCTGWDTLFYALLFSIFSFQKLWFEDNFKY